VKPAIVLLRHNENNYSISIALVGSGADCERFSFTRKTSFCRSCRWLLFFAFKQQCQKIAAGGNAYNGVASRESEAKRSSIFARTGKLPGRLCLAEGLCHDDPTAG
jgi:hypothetical protein